MLSPAQIVECVLRRKSERSPKPIRDQAVQTGALIHFIEMRHRLPGKQDATGLRMFHRRTIHVVQHSFDQVAGGREVF